MPISLDVVFAIFQGSGQQQELWQATGLGQQSTKRKGQSLEIGF